MFNKVKENIKENIAFCVFLCVTAMLMLVSIIWVYHTKVLNAPKVYSDGFGYFAYLPATLIYQDFSFSFVEGWEHPLKLIAVEGAMVNKYPVGVAIMESPFFLAAHIISLIRDALTGSVTATGYTNLYQYAILFCGVVYWIVGTTLLYRLLNKYLHFSKRVSCIVCILITYGTNLFHYASYDACFSHIYSYTLFITFLYYLCWYEQREERKNTIWHTCVFGIIAGLIFMCRNTNILFVLTYVFYGVRNWKSLKDRVKTILHWKRAVPIVVTGFITIMPQLLYWHTVTGKWFVYSYGSDEPFYWLAPEIVNFLFSVRKGLFFWSPILLIPIIGMILAYKKKDKLYTGLVVFFVLIVYVSSAWWSWYYGGSLGQRVAVDFMCVFAIFLAYILEWLKDKRKHSKLRGIQSYLLEVVVYLYCGICVVWNVICTLAYWYRIIPSDKATWQDIQAVLQWL
ncbi:MAG: hypothetical protein J6B68_05330 [Lachnospiraceae bacterium]|nr:hypothetical protein [Lachnospiraceae bacterium]